MTDLPVTIGIGEYLVTWDSVHGAQCPVLRFNCFHKNVAGWIPASGRNSYVTEMPADTDFMIIAAVTARIVNILRDYPDWERQLELLSYMDQEKVEFELAELR